LKTVIGDSFLLVIPAQAGIHFDFRDVLGKSKANGSRLAPG
jgi:hypothetical protein